MASYRPVDEMVEIIAEGGVRERTVTAGKDYSVIRVHIEQDYIQYINQEE